MSELLKINVNEHVEKKNGLSYLSWAWAWAEVLKIDPGAEWTPQFFGPENNQTPWVSLPDGSMMVGVTVMIKGLRQQCMLPVMDHRNKAIKNPDAFAVNTALMRCLAKCIAMHGLGLYIYAGEDLPEDDSSADTRPAKNPRTSCMQISRAIKEHIANDRPLGALQEYEGAEDLGLTEDVWAGPTTPEREYITNAINHRNNLNKRAA